MVSQILNFITKRSSFDIHHSSYPLSAVQIKGQDQEILTERERNSFEY